MLELRREVLSKEKPRALTGNFDEKIQLQLANEIADAFGYDLNTGRIDQAVHPFSSGSGDDVRITTRTDSSDPFNCIYSTIHEVGHATYEQNIQKHFIFSPLGRGVSLGVHESQSRIYENQLGRSRPFTAFLFHRMRDLFGDFGIDDPEMFYKCVNRVDTGFIRTEADELQYNLHVMLRFDLEKSLISGDLIVNEIEDAWNARFESDFGYAVKKPSQGVLQDVHWAAGAFGYFPTYALGAMISSQIKYHCPFYDAFLDNPTEQNIRDIVVWLNTNIHQKASLLSSDEMLQNISGEKLNSTYYSKHLKDRFIK